VRRKRKVLGLWSEEKSVGVKAKGRVFGK